MNYKNTLSILFRTPLLPLSYVSKEYFSHSSPLFQIGIYLSSKPLYHELQKIEYLAEAKKIKLNRSLAKYQLRACTRPTPFASFAGLTTGTVSNVGSELILKNTSAHKLKLRLDNEVISKMVSSLLAEPKIATQLQYTTNNSLYPVADGYRYAEYQLQKGIRKYHLSNINQTPYLSALLATARQPTTYTTLLEILQKETKAEAEDANDYLQELINAQILISSLEPSITGNDALTDLIGKIEQLQHTEAICEALLNIQRLVGVKQATVAHLQQIDEALTASGLCPKLPDTTLQADLFLNSNSTHLNGTLVAAIIKQAEALFVLARTSKHPDLEDFKANFVQRYEDQMMPLAQALDADLGIGYGSVKDELAAGTPLIDELPVSSRGTDPSMTITSLNAFAQSKYEQWLQEKAESIEITDEDLEPFVKVAKDYRFPDSMALMGSLLKKNGQLNEQYFLFDLSNLGGPSAGNLLGRFAYGDDKILSLTRALLAEEESLQPDVIFAEIAHQPQARIGNILMRPILRQYEIPYVGLSGAVKECQIKLEDLWVKVQGNEITLWSKQHNKRIIPRLTTAHNYSYQSLPVYKFLCDLQHQGLSMPALWDWGVLDSMKHLPRVVYKNIVLRKALWTIAEKDLKDLPKDKNATHEFVSNWYKQKNLPQRVVYTEGDNELLIDFNEQMGRALFLNYLKKYKQIRLEEFLFTEENAVVHNEQGEPFTNEIIIPITRIAATTKIPFNISAQLHTTQRTFLPGSEWVYYKIYCGTKTAETILKNTFLPFIENGAKKKLFEYFFFIRYKDEGAHIRLRFYVTDNAERQKLQEAFYSDLVPLQQQGVIHKVVCDTYHRELERYGSDCITLAEQLFYNDSLAVLRFIDLLEGEEANRYRMLFALRGIDMLLDDFGISISEKQQLLSGIQKSFYQEFGGHVRLQKALNEKYRQNQKDIFLHMDKSKDIANDIDDAVAVFQIRSEMNKPVIAKLKEKAEKEEWINWLPSYIHMFMNRLFIAQQRKYELVVYHFLEKYYSSQLAIQKSKHKIVILQ
ncbi:MAG: lantibiotic dehydratase [Bacteroidetes bacterium]|nr:lantibiotic dehydratase [Bacteroidota bacterium]MBS1739183.1 lantibiotic dehydratase [Bacteroidota bacterium]